MSFNPSLSVNGSEVRAGELRGQFNGLKELIGNSSGGQPGPPGPAGADGRGIAAVNDNGDGRCVIRLTDGSSAGPFTVAMGPQGLQGEPGPAGIQGPPGEVTAQQLSDAIAGTSSNSNGIATLSLIVSDPPTQSEVQQLLDSYNALILALRRNV